MKLGSLFDGSGGFPLSGAMCGIEPTWAAEVEPYPIAVTKSRFPNMKHLGSVTDVRGNEIEPVDIITFGSPCQDLSVAGKRAGLKHETEGDDETTRSGLFMEAVRIIKEMRDATNGVYPRFAVWENVPGAFSSNKGEDFRIVLERLIQIVEPTAVMPDVPKAGWAYADYYRGNGWSIAHRTLDSQYWGVPQRRRRIYLVLCLGDECAGEVLFKREGLRGYFAEGRAPWQRTPQNVKRSIGADDTAVSFEPGIAKREGGHIYEGVSGTIRANAGDNKMSVAYSVENHPADSRVNLDDSGKVQTLTSRMGTGGGNVPMVMEAMPSYCIQDKSIGRKEANSCHGLGVAEEKAYTLTGVDRHAVAYGFDPGADRDVGKLFVEEKSKTLTNGTCPGHHNGVVCTDVGWLNSEADQSPTLLARMHKDPHLVSYWDGGQTVGTLTANNAGGNQRMPDKENFNCVIQMANGKDVTGCLMASGYEKLGAQEMFSGDYTVLEQKPNRYIVRRLTPTECARLQGFPDDWGHPIKKDTFTKEEYEFWLDVRNTHASINGKAVKNYTKDQMVSWYNKLHTDAAEYKMWGNGIALPTALYVMQGIAAVMEGKNG